MDAEFVHCKSSKDIYFGAHEVVQLHFSGLPIMFGLNYHHQPSDGGNMSIDLPQSVDFPDLNNFSINASSPHNFIQTTDEPELTTQVHSSSSSPHHHHH